uniref:Uncharacterized protein n=1 Tax=Arundo donax TaxID=35708 RepID=A0A0A9BUF8_ARUDO
MFKLDWEFEILLMCTGLDLLSGDVLWI